MRTIVPRQTLSPQTRTRPEKPNALPFRYGNLPHFRQMPLYHARLAGTGIALYTGSRGAERTLAPACKRGEFDMNYKTDAQIRDDVNRELLADPRVTASSVVVTVKDGVATLRGTIPQYIEKSKAEAAAWRVTGVKAVSVQLMVG